MNTTEDRSKIVKDAIDAIKEAAGFHEFPRTCQNCEFCELYDGDGSGYDEIYEFCGNPENEWKGAKPGDDCTWRIDEPLSSTCSRWKQKVSRW